MSEQQLCALLIRMGVESGRPIDAIVDELANLQLPSFVDATDFRASLVDVAEDHLRSEYESRVEELRRKVLTDADEDSLQMERSVPEQADVAGHVLETAPAPETPAEVADESGMDVFASPPADSDAAAASDETAVWMMRDGQPVRRTTPED